MKFMLVLARKGELGSAEWKRHAGTRNSLRRCLQKLEGVPSPPPVKPATILHQFLLCAAARCSLEWPGALSHAENEWHAERNPPVLAPLVENSHPVSTEKCRKGEKKMVHPGSSAPEYACSRLSPPLEQNEVLAGLALFARRL
jgi:hypothetical protein